MLQRLIRAPIAFDSLALAACCHTHHASDAVVVHNCHHVWVVDINLEKLDLRVLLTQLLVDGGNGFAWGQQTWGMQQAGGRQPGRLVLLQYYY